MTTNPVLALKQIFENEICASTTGKDLPEKWCMILPTYVEHSCFKHLATFISLCCVRVRSFFRSLFITGPSEPLRLITVAYVPSDPSPPFQLAAAWEQSRRTEKGVGTQLCDEPTYFHVAAKRLPAARSGGARPRNFAAAVRAAARCR